MTVISITTRREWIPVVRCSTCRNDRAATGAHTCRPHTPAPPDTKDRGLLTTP
jgi:hypothetical protein